MDVLGGRTLATYDMAHLLANDPAYVGQSLKGILLWALNIRHDEEHQ